MIGPAGVALYPWLPTATSILDGMPRFDLNSPPPQYVAARAGQYQAPEGWQTMPLGDWQIHVSPTLPAHRIVIAGQPIGYLLGQAVLPAAPQTTNDIAGESLEILDSLIGNWIALCMVDGALTAIMDPCGRVPLVYSISKGIAAASPSQDCFNTDFNKNLYTSLNMPDSGLYFPFGMTPYNGIERLMPNHRLNLETTSITRTWFPTGSTDFSAGVDAIAERVHRNVGAVLHLGSVALTLTAGYDSRVILSACRGRLAGLRSYTILGNAMDPLGSRRLSTLAGLDTTFLKAQRATPEERAAFLERSGHCIAGGVCDFWPTFLQFEAEHLLVGSGGEIFRHYWESNGDVPIDAKSLLQTMGFPALPDLVQAAEKWLQPLSGLTNGTILDLAYIEQRMGTWSAPETVSGCGFPGFTPFNDREIIDTGLAIPYADRADDAVPREIIRRLWPKLLSVPINQEPWTDAWIRRYKKVLKKIRGY